MAIKSWKDEDVLEFIACKQDGTSHWTANISVEVDDAFFAAWKRKDEWAKKVFDASVKAMLDNGEPGFWNVSRNRDGEPDPEEVFSCNPCGEITLHPNENCNLGHVNIGAYADESAKEAFRLMTRFLIRATFGDITDERQKRVVAKNRRIGVGFFGFQSWLVANGIKFSESHANLYVKECLRQWYLVVREEAQKYCYQLRIPECVKVTTIAPTGTTALLPGQTTGIQPIYARYAIRRVRYADNDPSLADLADHRIEDCIYSKNTKVVYFYYKDSLVDYAEKIWKNADLVEDQSEIHLADMLAVQAMIQAYYCDNAVSFTANILPDSLTFRELKSLLINYLPRLKGTTIMVDSTRAQAPYERISKNEFEMHESTVSQGEMECATGACPIR
jgi:adenosylcobalamin-dependent ribonucleoside-triphosphate reductase